MRDGNLQATLSAARERLLALRVPAGHWEGELSSSPLSTATAVMALDHYRRATAGAADDQRLAALCRRGLQWLADHQNSDGGWGDTTLSFSNISTTALVWSALAGQEPQFSAAERACRQWLAEQAGSLDPPVLAAAIRQRYGRDHTFSVPILTTLALAGRLGRPAEAWRLVPQLPFELAACPHRWFAWLRLPVVSYALPALIAIGQVRHRHRPTANPLMRLIRAAARSRTLNVLGEIQPASGGYLEATPLTSFVLLSLVGAGRADHPVARQAVEFLVQSIRPDGSWPIDTNLATWVTTLAANALGATDATDATGAGLDEAARAELRRWLLEQQYRVEHPYTHAPPGGWAWTNLSGGVPDADDTPGALLALKVLDDGSPAVRAAVAAGVGWLLDLQNSDGGVPTFCRGWGTLPFDRSAPDLTAHALRAWLAWRDALPSRLQQRIRRGVHRGLRYLARTQHRDGSWLPLWFGNQHVPDDLNPTYGTSRVLLGLAAVSAAGAELPSGGPDPAAAAGWLIDAQAEDGGWGGAAAAPPSLEETAVAVEALATIAGQPRPLTDSLRQSARVAVERGAAWLIEHTDAGRHFPPAPIGFYFARLWYYEQLYPLVFTTAALERAARLARQSAEPAHRFAEVTP